jgi:hypothetical protein
LLSVTDKSFLVLFFKKELLSCTLISVGGVRPWYRPPFCQLDAKRRRPSNSGSQAVE